MKPKFLKPSSTEPVMKLTSLTRNSDGTLSLLSGITKTKISILYQLVCYIQCSGFTLHNLKNNNETLFLIWN